MNSVSTRIVVTVCAFALASFMFLGCSGSGGADGPEQTPCTYDTECVSGQECGPNGVCIDKTTPDGDEEVEIPPDDCDFDSECDSNQVCHQHQCWADNLNPCAETEECQVDDDCGADQYCSDGCFCSQTSDTGPIIEVAGELDFGAILVGQPTVKTLEIFNRGTEELEVNSMEFAFDTEEFELDYTPGSRLRIVPGSSVTLTITYTASRGYEVSMPLFIANNSVNKPLATVVLKSEYKGESVIEFTPSQVNFGNVAVAESGLEIDVSVCNTGSGNKAITVTGLNFRYPASAPHFDYHTTITANAQEPYFLNTGSCFVVTVVYDPTEATIWPEEHTNELVINNDADNAVDRKSSIPLSGSADEYTLRVEPNPVQFGDVVVGEEFSISMEVANQSNTDLTIENMVLGGNHCGEFTLYLGDYDVFPFTMTSQQTINDIGVGYSPTGTGIDQGCYFVIEYIQSERSKFLKIPVTGSGRLENEPPVAKISRSDNGPDIIAPINIPPNATENQREITLFGDISSDPDGNYPLTYAWNVQAPAESNMEVYPNLESPYITFTVDWAGPYTASLVVTDSEGAVSEPKDVLINVSANEKIMIDMSFTGSGNMNVNLRWHAPNGTICSDEHMTSQRSCLMGDYGTAFVSNYTSSYDDGNKETIVHNGALDGAYTIQAAFAEDCASWDLSGSGLPFCLNRKNTTVTIKIYIDMETEPRWTLTKTMNNKGEVAEWFINKVGGEWNAPTQ